MLKYLCFSLNTNVILEIVVISYEEDILMSRKGNCMDNGAMENFFVRIKVEMFYSEKFDTVDEFINCIKEYIHYYNNERIVSKLKMSPVKYGLILLQENIILSNIWGSLHLIHFCFLSIIILHQRHIGFYYQP